MKKIIFIFSLLFITNSFSIGLADNGENLTKVLNTKIVCKDSSQLIGNLEVILNNLNGAEEFIRVFKNDIKYITYRKTYNLKRKFPKKTTKELKSLIRNGVEIDVVEYFNGKTITQVMDDESKMIKMGKKYLENLENLELLKIKKEISYRVKGLTVKKMNKSIEFIVNHIETKVIKNRFKDSIKKIEARIGINKMPMYLHGRTVYGILREGEID